MPDRRRYGRTPDAILLLAALAVVAGVLTITGMVPKSVLDLVPYEVGVAWSGTLALSAAAALAGILWREELTGWGLEIAGRIGVCATASAYVVALWNAATVPGTALVVAIIAAVAGASGWRVWQLARRADQFRVSVARQKRAS